MGRIGMHLAAALVAFFLFMAAASVLGQEAAKPANVAGRWVVTTDFWGTPQLFVMKLMQEGEKVSGDFSGDKIAGTLANGTLRFFGKDDQGGSEDFTGTIAGDEMKGSILFVDGSDKEHPTSHTFTATRVPARPGGAAKRHEFAPTVFYRQFSPFNKPVLTINAGDTVHTTTVDAGGTDEQGITRVVGGNPETGPFYVEQAAPGDTLVVRINKLKLNRDWAISDDGLVERALDSDLAGRMKDVFNNVRWKLDREKMTGTSERPGEHLVKYTIPLKAMLGCVATAVNPSSAPPPTGDSGRFGGNMDFNEITEGATVYLPVSVQGALLYLGDGHAMQGDGELNGNALETSMDVEFSVDVISENRIGGPRVESATHVMAMGLAGSLDDAFRAATSNMARWLMDDYKLTPSEVAQVLGTAAEYRVSEVADRNAGIVLKIDKSRLKGIGAAK